MPRKHGLGGPWVTVRAHYGALPLVWLDETGEGRAKACLDGELARACARKNGPRDEEAAAGGTPGGVSVASVFRRSGRHAAALLPRCAFRRSASPHLLE